MTPFEEPSREPAPSWSLSSSEDEPSALLDGRPTRGHTALAWFAILSVTVLVAVLQYIRPDVPGAANAPAPMGDELSVIFDMQFRQLVALGERVKDQRQQIAEQAEKMEVGTVRQRLRTAVVLGDLMGPRGGLKSLDRLSHSVDFRVGAKVEDVRAAALLTKLYKANEEGKFGDKALADEERVFLIEELNWYGELALAPRDGPDSAARAAVLEPAERALMGFLAGLAGICGGLVLGLGFLILIIVVVAGGPHKRGFKPGSEYSGLYAETFAIWMIVFVGLQVGMVFAFKGEVPVPVTALVPLVSLLVLYWPVQRGAKWEQVKADLGLTFGQRPLAEILSGPMTWLSALPIVLLIAFIMLKFGIMPMPGATLAQMPIHPIALKLRNADSTTLFFLFFAACVTAPIVEEIFFRGVFYRHLREGTGSWTVGWSIFVSMIVSAFIFAAVHPQGLIGIPLLMSLATAFALAREWRGSLVTCIVAHAINNGLLLTVMVNILGGG